MSQDYTVKVCPLCHDDDAQLLFVKSEIPYFACGKCGFKFSFPQANANFHEHLGDYENAYLQYLGSDLADERNFADVRNWMSSCAELDNVKLLDVGCGSGKWVRHLRGLGVDAIGIEPSAVLFNHFLAQDNYFINADLGDQALEQIGNFDVITIFDVLEHVEDPIAMLRYATKLLKPSGCLFLSLPDSGSFVARAMGKYWHHFNRYHFSFFNRATLEDCGLKLGLTSAGFCYRGRYRPLSYVTRYLFEILLRRNSPAFFKRFDNWYLPINIYDTMSIAFQKTQAASKANK